MYTIYPATSISWRWIPLQPSLIWKRTEFLSEACTWWSTRKLLISLMEAMLSSSVDFSEAIVTIKTFLQPIIFVHRCFAEHLSYSVINKPCCYFFKADASDFLSISASPHQKKITLVKAGKIFLQMFITECFSLSNIPYAGNSLKRKENKQTKEKTYIVIAHFLWCLN